jgi:ABC-type molybdate transport system permease subunit
VLAVFTATASLLASSVPALPLFLPPLLYGLLLVILVAPVNILHRPVRHFFGRTLLRVLLPLQPVTWADFLLADMLTSLAKSCLDMQRSVCLMLQGGWGGWKLSCSLLTCH